MNDTDREHYYYELWHNRGLTFYLTAITLALMIICPIVVILFLFLYC